MNLDDKMRGDFKTSPGSVVAWIIMASWLYYHRFDSAPIISDTTYDKAFDWLGKNYDKVKHRYKHLITEDDFKSGSLYALKAKDYPQPLITIAEKLSRELSRKIGAEAV